MDAAKGVPGVVLCYDVGPGKADRYTVFLAHTVAAPSKDEPGFYACLVLSDDPAHPQGVGSMCEGFIGPHNGLQVAFLDLPAVVQEVVRRALL